MKKKKQIIAYRLGWEQFGPGMSEYTEYKFDAITGKILGKKPIEFKKGSGR